MVGHRDDVWHVSFSPDGERLASAGKDGAVYLSDTLTGKEVANLSAGDGQPVYHFAFRPNGQQLATADADGVIRLWFGKMAEGEWEKRKGVMGK